MTNLSRRTFVLGGLATAGAIALPVRALARAACPTPTSPSSGRSPSRAGARAWGQLAVAYTDDNDGNGFDQVMLGLGATNSDF